MRELAGREHDWPAYDSLSLLIVRAMSGNATAPPPLVSRAVRAAAQHDGTTLRGLLAEAARSPESYTVWSLVAMAEDANASRTVAESMLSGAKDAGTRMWVGYSLGATELAAGRWSAGARAFERARADATRADLPFEGERILGTSAACAALPSLPVPPADVVAMRDVMARWDAQMPPPNSPPNPYVPIRPHLRLYLLGVLDARLGALESAARHATALEQLPETPDDRPTIDLLARVLRASIAAQRGEHTHVLDLLEHTRGQLPMSFDGIRFVDVYGRWLRAEALRALHRDAEAIQWYHTLPQGQEYGGAAELALLGPSQLREAELRERQGDIERARPLYARFTDLWSNADAEGHALVRGAAERAALPRDSR